MVKFPLNMRSFFQKKLWIVLLASLALGAWTVLALSLDNVPFHEAEHYGHEQTADLPPLNLKEVMDAVGDIPMWKVILVWGLVALMVILFALLLSPEARKRLLLLLFRMTATAVAFWYLLSNYADKLPGLQALIRPPVENPSAADNAPIPVFTPPQVSPYITYLISFGFALLTIALIWGFYQGLRKFTALHTGDSLQEIARIARTSLKDLSAGRDSSDVIIKCYLRMSDVVADKRRLRREISMTPQEFALRLERSGLPGDAVRRLTRLFESVRYGDRKSAQKDVNEAVSCLTTILNYCGETV